MPGAPDHVRIRLEPLGRTLEVRRGAPLQDLLFDHGVEFPCGGRGACQGCRVRFLRGAAPVTPADAAALPADELGEGWRLGCQIRAEADLTLEVAQWEAVVLDDRTPARAAGRVGRGVAVDLGTTTMVAQLVDLATGQVLGVQTALNPQAVFGADIMSRVEAAVTRGVASALAGAVRRKIGEMIAVLPAGPEPIAEIVIAGNTVMHHLFTGRSVAPLARFPFETEEGGLATCPASVLGWRLAGDPPVHFLPCLGGFVGSDVLAGVLATGMHESPEPACLIDLGTNGEIVVGCRDGMLCASTAAGPAFEGGLLSMGMRAATGAISRVWLERGAPRCHVIGDVAPRGICGSGLVDAAAAGLDCGVIAANGRLAGGSWPLAGTVVLSQADIRQLQLAKAAIAAGLRILLGRMALSASDVSRVYLAGAFGNYVNRESARRIGLFAFPLDRVEPAGNTAMHGARMTLLAGAYDGATVRRRVTHVALAADPDFQRAYIAEMAFPSPS